MKGKMMWVTLLLTGLMLLNAQAETAIPGWQDGSPCAAEITRILEEIDLEGSPGYVPKEDRIAVFDFDGTLFGERFPTYFDHLLLKTEKMNKVNAIVEEIGQAPQLVFGNSSGDLAMGVYAQQNGGKAFMLLCDDTQRDYGDKDEAEKFQKNCEDLGIQTVSMKDEFETIYGEEVFLEGSAEEEPEAEQLPAA